MDDFLVAPCNTEAVGWLDRWPDWPAPMLAIYGPSGSGKSHLAHVFAARCGGQVVPASAISTMAALTLPETGHGLAIEADDGPTDEEGLLHLYNWSAETGRSLLFVSRRAPARWRPRLADLASRLAAAPAVAIGPPDDALIAAVLVKLFRDRQLEIQLDVVRFAVARLERTFAAAHDFVATSDRLSLAGGRRVTLPLAREALASMTFAREE